MIAPFVSQLAWIAGAAAAIVINSLWEGALLVVAVWLLLRAWPGLNAATRYMVWSATLVAAVVVPVATTLPFLAPAQPLKVATAVSAVRAPIPTVTHPLTAATKSVAAATNSVPAATMPEPRTTIPRFPERFRMTVPLPVSLTIFAIWALLALYSFVRLAIGLFRLEQLKRDALPLPVEYRDAMQRWSEVNKGSREVRLCVSDEIDVPVAVGLFDSMILIPHALLERLSEAEVDQISLHELAHLRRADDWTNGVQRLAIALFAWNPAVQFAGQQLDLEREVACDDWVLGLTGKVRPYALCLTKMAETSSWPRHTIPAPGVFATRKHISLRIERLLGAGRNVATNLTLGPAAAALAIVGVLAFAMQLIAPSIAAPIAETQPQPRAAIVSNKTETRVVAQAAATPAAEPAATSAPVLHAPGTHVHLPARAVYVPAINVDVPAMNVPMPRVDTSETIAAARRLAYAQRGLTQAQAVSSTGQSIAAAISSAFKASAGVPSNVVAQSARSCTGCNFARVDWSGKDMHGVNYTGSDFTGATLRGTNFAGGTFSGVDFSHADLRGASFRDANLTGVDFSGADLTGVNFAGAKLTGGDFSRTNLNAAEIRSILNSCSGCDFSGANLAGLDLSGIRAQGDDFSKADLRNANLSGASLTGIDFSHAKLDGANLNGATLNGCDLGGVDLTHVDLSKTHLIGIDLSNERH